MKKILAVQNALIVILVLISTGGIKAQSEYTNLVWSDEFDYTGNLDMQKWNFEIGGDGWGNNELQYYTNRTENAKVENGKLIITTRKENFSSNNYTSARITSKGKGDWLYARIEVRAKLPEGIGTWPAIWTLPTDWEYGGWPASGEIDIMEHVGYEMGIVHGTVHTEAYNGKIGTQRGGDIHLADAHTNFHVYAIEWEPDSIHFIADDVRYYSYPNYNTGFERWPFDKRFHLLLNIAIGGDWGGIKGVDDSIFPQTMEIDYVRVYQKFQQQTINGSEELNANQQDVVYSVPNFSGASYQWSFPEGVAIIEGQGANEIHVNWGDVAGAISVSQSYGDDVFVSQLEIAVLSIPDSDKLTIRGNEINLGIWSEESGEGNLIVLENEK